MVKVLSLQVASQNYEIVIGAYTDDPFYDKSITLLHLIDDSLGGDSVEYQLGHDGVVRRIDSDMTTYVRRLHMNDKIHPSTSDRRTAPFNLQDMIAHKLDESVRNQELETLMGLNNQPVGLDEINHLIELMQSAVQVTKDVS